MTKMLKRKPAARKSASLKSASSATIATKRLTVKRKTAKKKTPSRATVQAIKQRFADRELPKTWQVGGRNYLRVLGTFGD